MIPPSESEPPNLHAVLGLDDRGRRLLWPGTAAELHRRGFDLREPIAQGATSVVFACVERATGRALVLKVCHDPSQSAALESFRRERQILAGAADQLNLLPHYYGGVGEDDPASPGGEPCQPFLLLEYLDGIRIGDHLLAVAGAPLDQTLRLCVEFLRVVQGLHDLNIVHGDLSTNNALVESGGRVRLIDLGQGGLLSGGCQLDALKLDRAGTVGFSPASLLSRCELPSQATDIRQAVAVVFYLLTGEVAGSDCEEEGAGRRQAMLESREVPPEVARIVQRGLRDRDIRLPAGTHDPRLYRTAGEIAGAFEGWLAASQRRGQVLRLAVRAISLVALVLGCAWWIWTRWQHQHLARETELARMYALQNETLSNSDHPALTPLRDQLRERQQAEMTARASGDRKGVLGHLQAQIELLRQIGLRHDELTEMAEQCDEWNTIAGHWEWNHSAPVVRQAVFQLCAQGREVQRLLEEGKVEAAVDEMRGFRKKMLATIKMDLDARSVAALRKEVEDLQSRLYAGEQTGWELDDGEELRLEAERAWGAGDWNAAARLYGELRLALRARLGLGGPSSDPDDAEPALSPKPSAVDPSAPRTDSGPLVPIRGGDERGTREESSLPEGEVRLEGDAAEVTRRVTDGAEGGTQLVINRKGVSFQFRWCPPATFRMGSPSGEWKRELDEEQVEVTLTRGFWLLETEVTQRMWCAVRGDEWRSQWEERFGLGDHYPAYRVSGVEGERFCRLLTEGLREEGWLGPNWRVVLPTEAQWEYACRAGSEGPYCCGEDGEELRDFAWFAENAEGTNHPVRTRQPNRWGLYDMHGSVWEWTASRYGPRMTGGGGPVDGVEEGVRVLRGGSWVLDAAGCRSAIRKRYGQLSADVQTGIRLCLLADPSENMGDRVQWEGSGPDNKVPGDSSQGSCGKAARRE